MATGIVGVLSASASLSYTPASNAKLSIIAQCSTGGACTVNGGNVAVGPSSGNTISQVFVYVGASQAVTIATAASSSAVVSTIEEN